MFVASTLPSPTGAELRLFTALAGGPAKAAIQVNHGMAEHAARYERFGEFLNANGYHLFAHDHRGHGETKASDAPLGTFALAPLPNPRSPSGPALPRPGPSPPLTVGES